MTELEPDTPITPVDSWAEVDPDWVPFADPDLGGLEESASEDLSEEELAQEPEEGDALEGPQWVRFELWAQNLSDGTERYLASTADFDGPLEVEIGNLTPGDLMRFWVRLIDSNGRHSNMSDPIDLRLPVDLTPPGRPTAPTVAEAFGLVAIHHDGELESGVKPDDFSHIIIYAQQMHPPGNPSGPPGGARAITRITQEASTVVGDFFSGIPHRVFAVAVDTTGNESARSEYVEVTPRMPFDDTELQETLRNLNEEVLPKLAGDQELLEQAMEHLNTVELPGLQAQLESGLAEIEQNRVQLQQLSEEQVKLDEAMDHLNEVELPGLETRLRGGIDEVNKNLLPLQQLSGQNKARLDTLNNTTLPGIERNLQAVESDLSTAKGQLSTAQGQLNTLRNTTIPGITSDLEAAQGELATLNSDTLPDLNVRLRAARDGANLITDPFFSDDALFAARTGRESVEWSHETSPTHGDYIVAQRSTTTNTLNFYTSPFLSLADARYYAIPVTPGEQYRINVEAGGSGQGRFRLTYEMWRADGTHSYYSVPGSSWTTAGWKVSHTAVFTPPADAIFISPAVQWEAGTPQGRIYTGTFRLERMTDTTLIVPGAILTDHLAANAITSDKVSANAITTAKIATGAVTANEIAALTITANELATNSVTAGKILANAVTTAKIAANAVTANEIAANTITAGNIATNAIQARHLQANSVGADQIIANSVGTGHLQAKIIQAEHMVLQPGNLVTNPTFEDGAKGWSNSRQVTSEGPNGENCLVIPATETQQGAYLGLNTADRPYRIPVKAGSSYHVSVEYRPSGTGATHPAPGQISLYCRLYTSDGSALAWTSPSVVRNTEQGRAFNWGNRVEGIVTVPEDATNTYMVPGVFVESAYPHAVYFARPSIVEAAGSKLIVNGSVLANHLAANSITGDKIAANQISSRELSVGAVQAGNIAANAVNADKIASNAVTTAKIATNAVRANEIAGNTIVAGNIASNAIQTRHITAGSVSTNELAASAVNADKIAANAITTAKIAANAVGANEIAANAVTASQISAGAIDGMTITGAVIRGGEIHAGANSEGALIPDNGRLRLQGRIPRAEASARDLLVTGTTSAMNFSASSWVDNGTAVRTAYTITYATPAPTGNRFPLVGLHGNTPNMEGPATVTSRAMNPGQFQAIVRSAGPSGTHGDVRVRYLAVWADNNA